MTKHSHCLILEPGCVKSVFHKYPYNFLESLLYDLPFFRLPPQERFADQPFTTNFVAQQIQKSRQVGPFFSGSLRLKALQSELEISKALFAVFAEGSCSPQMCLDQPSQGIFGVAYRQRNKVYPHDEDLSSMCVKKSSCSATWHSNVCFFVSARRFPFPKMAFVQCAREKWQDPHIIDLYIHAYGKLTYCLLFDGKDGVYVLPFPSGKPFPFPFVPLCVFGRSSF